MFAWLLVLFPQGELSPGQAESACQLGATWRTCWESSQALRCAGEAGSAARADRSSGVVWTGRRALICGPPVWRLGDGTVVSACGFSLFIGQKVDFFLDQNSQGRKAGVCVHVCLCVYVYVHVHVLCVHLCMHMHASAHMHARMCLCVHACISMCAHACMCTYMCACTCMCICVPIYVHPCAHIHVCVHACVHACVHVCELQ